MHAGPVRTASPSQHCCAALTLLGVSPAVCAPWPSPSPSLQLRCPLDSPPVSTCSPKLGLVFSHCIPSVTWRCHSCSIFQRGLKGVPSSTLVLSILSPSQPQISPSSQNCLNPDLCSLPPEPASSLSPASVLAPFISVLLCRPRGLLTFISDFLIL